MGYNNINGTHKQVWNKHCTLDMSLPIY